MLSRVLPRHALFVLPLFGAASAAWIAYFRWKDKKRPEPVWLMLLALALGALSVGPALAGYAGFGALGYASRWDDLAGASWAHAASSSLVIGAAEEGAKLAAVLPIALLSSRFDELLDGIVYAACAGAGFAAAESAALLLGGELSARGAVARAVTAPIAHALFAAPWGLGLALLVLGPHQGPRRAMPIAAGFAASAVAHSAYDLCLARPSAPRWLAAAIVGALWLWLLWIAPRLARLAPQPRA